MTFTKPLLYAIGAHINLKKIPIAKFSDKETEAQISLMMHAKCALAHGLIKEKEKVEGGCQPIEA